jgi:hypothetical protein
VPACERGGLDGAARLLLDHAAEDHGAVGADREEEDHGHKESGGLVVGAASLDLTELQVADGHRLDNGEEFVGVHPGGLGPVAHGEQLDGAGHDGLELLVGALAPLELPGVHHEDVDVPVAYGSFAGGSGVVVMDADGGVDGVALCLHGGGEPCWRRSGQPNVLGAGPGVEECGQYDGAGDGQEHHQQRREEGARTAALADLAGCDEPDLARAVHAATASRNSSESVGGSYANDTRSVLRCAAASIAARSAP